MRFNWHDRRKEKGERRKEGRKGSSRSLLVRVCHVSEERERRCVRVYEWEHLKGEEAARAHTRTEYTDKSDIGIGMAVVLAETVIVVSHTTRKNDEDSVYIGYSNPRLSCRLCSDFDYKCRE